MTSANDAPERDPKSWVVEGSNDGQTWAPIDSQTNQSFTGRQQEKDYKSANTTAYSSYRLNISANSGGNRR